MQNKSHQDPLTIRSMFSSIAGRYDLANHVLSGGLDFVWRNAVSKLARDWSPTSILDIATGSGDLAFSLQKACPSAMIIGADFCIPMLMQAAAKGLQHPVVADGTRLPFKAESFDLVTVGFGLRNMHSYDAALKEFRRVLKPNGHLCVLDFSLPQNALLGQLYLLYLRKVLPSIAGFLTGNKEAYRYLGDSIIAFPRGKKMIELLSHAGFAEGRQIEFAAGIVSAYLGYCSPPSPSA